MQNMTIVTSKPSIPSIPPELWAQVIGYTRNHDLAHVWTQLRHVSRTFRQEIERNFSKLHLPKTIIHFFLTNVRIFNDNSIHNATMNTSLSFVRLSDDGQTAFFRLDQHDAHGEDWIFEAIDRRSPEEINDGKQMVQIRSRIHDIYIPDLNVDKERKEISFNWVKVFSLFFAERYSVDLFHEQWMLESVGSEEMPHMWMRQDPNREARKKARRHRIRRQSEELTGKSIVFDKNYEMVEAKALGEIENAEYAAGFEMYSDGEDTYAIGTDALETEVEESLWRWAVDGIYDIRMPDHFI